MRGISILKCETCDDLRFHGGPGCEIHFPKENAAWKRIEKDARQRELAEQKGASR